MQLKPLIFSMALLASLGGSAIAQTEQPSSASEIEPAYWPQEPRPELSTTSFYTKFDGIDVPMYLIQSDKLRFEIANRQTLRINKTSSSRYSGELIDSQVPGISLGISVFKQGEFLPDLSEESWAAYKKGLLIEKPNIEIVLDNSNIDQPITPYVFGKKFRQVAYEQETQRAVIKRREIFAFVGPNLLVFTITGTKENVDRNWSSVEHLIGEMSQN